MNYFLLALSILPSVFLFRYFYKKDKYKKEPKKILLKVFILSAIITIPLAIFFGELIDFVTPVGVAGIFVSSFLSAALVEETLKYLIVRFFVFKSHYFDEVIDGVVYAVTASLGFATIENILYVAFSESNAYVLAIMRAVTAVPGHALDGAILGYFLGLAKLSQDKKIAKKLIRKGLFLAIVFHGLYDFFIFSGEYFPFAPFLIFPLLLIQFRLVFVALKQIHEPNPTPYLSLQFKELIQGFTLKSFGKISCGCLSGGFGLFLLLGLLGSTINNELQIEELPFILFITIACFVFSYFVITSITQKKKKRTSVVNETTKTLH